MLQFKTNHRRFAAQLDLLHAIFRLLYYETTMHSLFHVIMCADS